MPQAIEVLSADWQLFLAMTGLVAFSLIESVAPFFRRAGRLRHATRNLTLAAVNAAALALLLSGLTVTVAHAAETDHWGLLNTAPLTPLAKGLLALLVLDLWTYWWHRANHEVPFLWRFHHVHHSDPAMDVTTATRFHLGEIALSTITRLGIIALAGIPLSAIVGYEMALLLSTQFHHSNIGLPAGMDRALRAVIVSPNMHRVHHSIERVETDSNYAAVLSLWDRLFRTYRAKRDYRKIRFGVEGFSNDWSQSVNALLLTPLTAPSRRRPDRVRKDGPPYQRAHEEASTDRHRKPGVIGLASERVQAYTRAQEETNSEFLL